VLVSALSSDISFELYQEEFEVAQGDRLLLLSDGIYRQLSRKEIVSASASSSDITEFLRKIKNDLLGKGVVDDSTALCWEIG